MPGLPASPAQCPIGVPVTYFVYGGTPPYRVSVNLPTQVTLFGSPIPQNGGSFTATTNGSLHRDLHDHGCQQPVHQRDADKRSRTGQRGRRRRFHLGQLRLVLAAEPGLPDDHVDHLPHGVHRVGLQRIRDHLRWHGTVHGGQHHAERHRRRKHLGHDADRDAHDAFVGHRTGDAEGQCRFVLPGSDRQRDAGQLPVTGPARARNRAPTALCFVAGTVRARRWPRWRCPARPRGSRHGREARAG